ncbi:MAG: hypothetical protein ABSH11_10915 [Verrucomicrobiota bacterium]|jgi:hypothetical protein
MKANPLACALLVLLAVAVQLPAKQTTTNAVGTNNTSAGDIFDQIAAEQKISPSGTNTAATNKTKPLVGLVGKGTKTPTWDDTTPLPAKTPTTANNSKKLNSKPRADEFGFVPDTETQPVIQEFPDNTPPQKTKPADELVDWGLVASCVILGVLLIAISVLIFFSLVREVRRLKMKWMEISASKHNPQRIVLGLGLLLVILNGLFPPFEWTGWGHHQGYRFLFAPPEGSKIIFTRFFVQFVTIIAATAGAFLLFGMRDKKTPGKSQGMPDKPAEP